MLRFSIKDILWLTLVVALAITSFTNYEGWRQERMRHLSTKAQLSWATLKSQELTLKFQKAVASYDRMATAYNQVRIQHSQEIEDLKAKWRREVNQIQLAAAERERRLMVEGSKAAVDTTEQLEALFQQKP